MRLAGQIRRQGVTEASKMIGAVDPAAAASRLPVDTARHDPLFCRLNYMMPGHAR